MDAWEPGFGRAAAVEALEAAGCRLASQPSEDPDMPDDVTALSGEDLGKLHGLFCAWSAYLEDRVALADIDAAEAGGFLDHAEAAVHLKKSGTVADRKAKTQNDPAFIAAQVPALTARAKVKLLKARLAGYEKCAAALSREITRRDNLLNRLPQ